MTITKKKMLAWQSAKKSLAEAKVAELKLRLEICKEVAGDQIEGVCKLEKFGAVITATPKLNRKIDLEIYRKLLPDLPVAEKACIQYKPALKKKEYDKLPTTSVLHTAVTATPGTPTLEIKQAKTEE